MKRLSKVLVTGALLAFGTQQARAQDTFFLQSFVAPSGISTLASFTWGGFQTSSPYSFGLYEFDGAQLTSGALWSQAMTSAVSSFTVQTLTPDAAVTPGTQYAIGVTTTGTSQQQALFADLFPGGRAYNRSGDHYVTFAGEGDITGFSATFGTTVTPEPASLGLLATGLIGLAALRYRRS